MALSPLSTVRVAWQTCLVDVQPTSRFGVRWDTAVVSSTFQLEPDGARSATFLLPAAQEPDAPPGLTVLPAAATAAFERVGGAEADHLAPEPAHPELWERAKELAAGGIWRADAPLADAAPLVHFLFAQRIEPDEGLDVFELRLLAPLASFLVADGGRATVAVALPHLPDRLVTLHHGYVHDGGQEVSSGTEQELSRRRFVSHLWEEPDELLRLRYAYSRPR